MNQQTQFAKICDLTSRQHEILSALLMKYTTALDVMALEAGHQGAVAVSPDGMSLIDPTRPIPTVPAQELLGNRKDGSAAGGIEHG